MIKFTVKFSHPSSGKPGKRTVHARDAEEAKARVSVLVPGSFWLVATRVTPAAPRTGKGRLLRVENGRWVDLNGRPVQL